jgi:hypothetical protein
MVTDTYTISVPQRIARSVRSRWRDSRTIATNAISIATPISGIAGPACGCGGPTMNAGVPIAIVALSATAPAKIASPRRGMLRPARLRTTKVRLPSSTGNVATAIRAGITAEARSSCAWLRAICVSWMVAVASAHTVTHAFAAWPRRASVRWSAAM